MAQMTLNVEGMSCDHCKRAVEMALEKLDGVERAEVSLDENTVSVTYDESQVTTVQMKEAVEEEGYKVIS